jgi:hypothetical protein
MAEGHRYDCLHAVIRVNTSHDCPRINMDELTTLKLFSSLGAAFPLGLHPTLNSIPDNKQNKTW